MATIIHTGTEYVANALTLSRGTVDDIVSVGVFHTLDPNVVPTPADFTTVQLVTPGDALASGTNVDVLSLIGPRDGDLVLPPGTYQRWVLVVTATEDIMRKIDTLVVV